MALEGRLLESFPGGRLISARKICQSFKEEDRKESQKAVVRVVGGSSVEEFSEDTLNVSENDLSVVQGGGPIGKPKMSPLGYDVWNSHLIVTCLVALLCWLGAWHDSSVLPNYGFAGGYWKCHLGYDARQDTAGIISVQLFEGLSFSLMSRYWQFQWHAWPADDIHVVP